MKTLEEKRQEILEALRNTQKPEDKSNIVINILDYIKHGYEEVESKEKFLIDEMNFYIEVLMKDELKRQNNYCKHLREVPDGDQEDCFLYKCDLLKADDVDKNFHVIATAYQKQYPEKQMVPNGECFWVRQENLKGCPLSKEK